VRFKKKMPVVHGDEGNKDDVFFVENSWRGVCERALSGRKNPESGVGRFRREEEKLKNRASGTKVGKKQGDSAKTT